MLIYELSAIGNFLLFKSFLSTWKFVIEFCNEIHYLTKQVQMELVTVT